ncbi:MAG: HlyD family efflux transporter periplasmic adaptor subunit [Bacteroidetes bacterium]|nr:HlyD family efflux transporter periplasmic adaptor subunit [Bacteroidota bacterium]
MPIAAHQYNQHQDTQFIIGIIPPWIVRWGVLLLFFLLSILVVCALIIRFPDVLTSRVIVASRSQPYKISWYRNGPQVHKLFVRQNQMVHVGDTLLSELNLADSALNTQVSPLDGKILLTHGTIDNPQRSILMIEPPDSSYDIYVDLPAKGLGNVRNGQTVLIAMDAFPEAEYGRLRGRISSLIPMGYEGGMRAEVKLTDGMVTTEGKELLLQRFNQGSAEVILTDKNLLQRIFGNVLPNDNSNHATIK